MKLTQEQKDLVFSQISAFAGNTLGCGFGEMDDISGNLLDEVVTAIEETADWSDLESDEVFDGDIIVAIGRVITKHLNNKKKVFVLTTQWSVDYEQGSDVGVYSTKELAKKEMKRDYENMCEEYPDWVGSIDDNCAEMQEEGDYTRNHCDWQIKEIEVITK